MTAYELDTCIFTACCCHILRILRGPLTWILERVDLVHTSSACLGSPHHFITLLAFFGWSLRMINAGQFGRNCFNLMNSIANLFWWPLFNRIWPRFRTSLWTTRNHIELFRGHLSIAANLRNVGMLLMNHLLLAVRVVLRLTLLAQIFPTSNQIGLLSGKGLEELRSFVLLLYQWDWNLLSGAVTGNTFVIYRHHHLFKVFFVRVNLTRMRSRVLVARLVSGWRSVLSLVRLNHTKRNRLSSLTQSSLAHACLQLLALFCPFFRRSSLQWSTAVFFLISDTIWGALFLENLIYDQ